MVGTEKRDKYVQEMISWLECVNRSWIDDHRQIDVANGGCAALVAMSAIKQLRAKLDLLGASTMLEAA